MRVRFVVSLFAVLLALAACSTTDDRSGDVSEQVTVGEREDITAGPLYGTETYDSEALDGPAPGTQADLVVNVGDRVFFGYDRYDLTSESQGVLDMQAQWMQQYPHVTITIEGHADERGTREYNLALGERRATAVKNYLIARGVDPRRIETVSYGKEKPAVPESTPSAWAQNRRGVTKVD